MIVRFDSLCRPGLLHFQTDRFGGVSRNEYESLNLGFSVGDSYRNVMINREMLAREIGIGLDNFVFCRQVHGNHVHPVTAADKGRGADLHRHDTIPATDGLVTNVTGIVLCIKTADCLPLFLYDPIRHAAGIAHVGWKGALKKLPSATICAMQEHYGSHPHNLIAVIGIGADKCCYTVSKEVFRYFFPDSEPEVTPKGTPLDLKGIVTEQLLESGIRERNIERSPICSICHSKTYFSARAAGGTCGFSLSGICLL